MGMPMAARFFLVKTSKMFLNNRLDSLPTFQRICGAVRLKRFFGKKGELIVHFEFSMKNDELMEKNSARPF